MSEKVGLEVEGALALAQDASLSFVLPNGVAGFVVRRGEGFVAYRNLCPHWGVDLDLGLGDFVDPRSGLVACRNHGAEFDPDSGLCVAGPCEGDSLVRLRVTLQDGRLRVETP